jgi:hypothetical protein
MRERALQLNKELARATIKISGNVNDLEGKVAALEAEIADLKTVVRAAIAKSLDEGA